MTFIFTALKTGDDSSMEKYVTSDPLTAADSLIYRLLAVIANFLADLMLVHRCYVVWNCNRHMIVILFVLTGSINVLSVISLIVLTIGSTSDNFQLYITAGLMGQACYGAYAAANLLITTLTASRIWWLSRKAKDPLSSLTPRLYQRIVAIILESGALYPIFSFVRLALAESTSEIGLPIEIRPTVTLIAGIAPALMIVRCRVFNALQDHNTREVGALSTLQFNPNTGIGMTHGQIDSQARNVEGQSESSGAVNDSKGDGNARDEEKGMDTRLSSSLRAI
ncbi:hypothetical protein PQX77_017491 [Marasmius sp. AFHP31]|nr:hypothetical protein PQX77_017491 [Marasmius sp. AFHP31]